jgi:hypothetical protein
MQPRFHDHMADPLGFFRWAARIFLWTARFGRLTRELPRFGDNVDLENFLSRVWRQPFLVFTLAGRGTELHVPETVHTKS